MMKHNIAISTGLAVLFVLPAAFGQEDVSRLNQALKEISHAIDVMAGIEQKLQEEPTQGIDLVIGATEAPHLEQRELDDRLGSLRKEVSLLQMELDALESPGSALTLQPFVPSGPAGDTTTTTRRPPTAGLDDSLRAAISTRQPGQPQTRVHSGSKPRTTTTPAGPSPEFEGYTADPIGQARACYRVGRYKQGLDLLEEAEGTTALYWRARCLERLDRIDEAIAILERIVADEGESYEGQRAAKDLEFLHWKKQFLQKLPTGMKEKQG